MWFFVALLQSKRKCLPQSCRIRSPNGSLNNLLHNAAWPQNFLDHYRSWLDFALQPKSFCCEIHSEILVGLRASVNTSEFILYDSHQATLAHVSKASKHHSQSLLLNFVLRSKFDFFLLNTIKRPSERIEIFYGEISLRAVKNKENGCCNNERYAYRFFK